MVFCPVQALSVLYHLMVFWSNFASWPFIRINATRSPMIIQIFLLLFVLNPRSATKQIIFRAKLVLGLVLVVDVFEVDVVVHVELLVILIPPRIIKLRHQIKLLIIFICTSSHKVVCLFWVFLGYLYFHIIYLLTGALGSRRSGVYVWIYFPFVSSLNIIPLTTRTLFVLVSLADGDPLILPINSHISILLIFRICAESALAVGAVVWLVFIPSFIFIFNNNFPKYRPLLPLRISSVAALLVASNLKKIVILLVIALILMAVLIMILKINLVAVLVLFECFEAAGAAFFQQKLAQIRIRSKILILLFNIRIVETLLVLEAGCVLVFALLRTTHLILHHRRPNLRILCIQPFLLHVFNLLPKFARRNWHFILLAKIAFYDVGGLHCAWFYWNPRLRLLPPIPRILPRLLIYKRRRMHLLLLQLSVSRYQWLDFFVVHAVEVGMRQTLNRSKPLAFFHVEHAFEEVYGFGAHLPHILLLNRLRLTNIRKFIPNESWIGVKFLLKHFWQFSHNFLDAEKLIYFWLAGK